MIGSSPRQLSGLVYRFFVGLLLLPLIAHPMISRAEAPLAEAPAFTVVLQQGRDGYSGAVDTFLSSWYPNRSYASKNPLAVRSDGASLPLLRFDLAPIPGYASITEAHLELYASGRGATVPFTAQLYRVLRPWDVNEATWNLAATGVPWETPGCDSAADREISPTVSLELGQIARWYSFDVTDLAKLWLADPSQNQGVLLHGQASQAMEYQFWSAEHSLVEYRPRLVVSYTFLSATPTPTRTTTATATHTATATQTGTPTRTPTPLPRTLYSRALQSVLAIDGDLSDWPGGNAVVLDWNSARSRYPSRPVSQVDCSMAVRSQWDQWNLYFAVQVLDEKAIHDNPLEEIWQDDSIEIAIDGNHDQQWGSAYDHLFSIRHDGNVVHTGAGNPEIVVRARPASDGYWMEVSIPWADIIGDVPPWSGLQAGINLGIHDDDDWGDYDAYFIWEGNAINKPAGFATLSCFGDGPWFRQTYQQGVNGLVHDTYINEEDRARNYGQDARLKVRFDGNLEPPPPPREKKASLLHFDIPNLPNGAILTRAVLYVYAVESSNADMELSAYQVRRSWTESGATWDIASVGNPGIGLAAMIRSRTYISSAAMGVGLAISRNGTSWISPGPFITG